MASKTAKEEEVKEEGGADSLNRNVVEAEAKPAKKTTRCRRSTKKAPKGVSDAPNEVEPEPEAEPDIQLTIETRDGEVIETVEERPDNAESGDQIEPSELEPAVEIPWIPPKRVIVKNIGGGPAVVGTKTLLPGEVGPATWPQFLSAADAHRGWFHWSEVGKINFRSEIPT